jgi:hypothetical protein
MEEFKKTSYQEVSNWLAHEGYPLEFRVAHRFREAGFRVLQGMHIPDVDSGKAREIDVIGLKSLEMGETTFYFVCLIECKWSKSKPWVLFSSSEKDRGGCSLIAETIASDLGEVVVHILAADQQLQEDRFFESMQTTSYGGRVAFTKENNSDLFYSTVQSVISKAMLIAKADDPKSIEDSMTEFGSIVFPVVVVDGELFEASYNPETDNVNLEKREHMRLRWSARGSADHAVNIVGFEFLERFIRTLAQTADTVLEKSKPIIGQLIECFAQGTEYPEIPEVDRPYTGQPGLLSKLDELQRQRLKKV